MNSGRANVANLYQLYTLIEKYKILFIVMSGLIPIVCAQLKIQLVHKVTIKFKRSDVIWIVMEWSFTAIGSS